MSSGGSRYSGDIAVACFLFCAGTGYMLGEWGAFSEDGAFPVNYVDGDDEDEGYANCFC